MPKWVEADPLRGRAVDALGLQITADRIADEMLPGLSVLTNRARYYSLLSWARSKCDSQVDESKIHRIEVALACREAVSHQNNEEECRFVGSRNLRGFSANRPPVDPKTVYRNPVWRSYRASMRAIDLLDDADALTTTGTRLAKFFAKACPRMVQSGDVMLPETACLSRMSSEEAQIIKDCLGVWRPGKPRNDDHTPPGRRAETEREVRKHLRHGRSPASVISLYERGSISTDGLAAQSLRRAATWERLSVGLQALFLHALHNLHDWDTVVRQIKSARSASRRATTALTDIRLDNMTIGHALSSINAACRLRSVLQNDGLDHFEDARAFELAEQALGDYPARQLLEDLIERHVQTKLDDAWVSSVGEDRELIRDQRAGWRLPTEARVRSYRLGAFSMLLNDLQSHARSRS